MARLRYFCPYWFFYRYRKHIIEYLHFYRQHIQRIQCSPLESNRASCWMKFIILFLETVVFFPLFYFPIPTTDLHRLFLCAEKQFGTSSPARSTSIFLQTLEARYLISTFLSTTCTSPLMLPDRIKAYTLLEENTFFFFKLLSYLFCFHSQLLLQTCSDYRCALLFHSM